MHYRKRLIIYLERIYFLLKNAGWFSFIPVIGVNVIFPVFTYISYRNLGVCDEFYQNVSEVSQIFIPFLSIWCPILILKEFIDSYGKEIICLGKKSKSSWIIMTMFFLYCCNVMVIFTLCYIFFSLPYIELVKIILVSIFYMGSTVFLSKTTQNTSITILLLVVYTLSNFIFYKMEGIFPFYYTNVPTTISMIHKNLFPLSLVGILEFVLGNCIRANITSSNV